MRLKTLCLVLAIFLQTGPMFAGQCAEPDAAFLADVKKQKEVDEAVGCLAEYIHNIDFSRIGYLTDLDFNMNTTQGDIQEGRRLLMPLLKSQNQKLRCDAAATLARYGATEAFLTLKACPMPVAKKATGMVAYKNYAPAIAWATQEFDNLPENKSRRGAALALLNLLAHIGTVHEAEFINKVGGVDKDAEVRRRAKAVAKIVK